MLSCTSSGFIHLPPCAGWLRADGVEIVRGLERVEELLLVVIVVGLGVVLQ